MSEPVDYPREAPTGPQTAVLPHGPYQSAPQGYGYPPVPMLFASARLRRLNTVAACVSIAACSVVIIAVPFGAGFYFGRETAPKPVDSSAAGVGQQNGPVLLPLPRGQFERPGGGVTIPNGPTIELPNIFPQFPLPPQSPTPRTPGEPPR